MLYHFELQMAGAILLTAMLVGGISLWIKRRRERRMLEQAEPGTLEQAEPGTLDDERRSI